MTQFETLTGLTGIEFFAIVSLALMCLGMALFTRQPVAQIAASLLLMLLGVLLLFFNTSPIIVILAGLLLVLGALTFLQVGLQWSQRGKPERRRFFE